MTTRVSRYIEVESSQISHYKTLWVTKLIDLLSEVAIKAMRSENLIEYSIKIQVESNISRIFRTD